MFRMEPAQSQVTWNRAQLKKQARKTEAPTHHMIQALNAAKPPVRIQFAFRV